MAEQLIDRALELANERFDEHVDALIDEAGNDGARLALAAARLSTDGPAHSSSVEQIAFSLLIEAFHKTSRSDVPQHSRDVVAIRP